MYVGNSILTFEEQVLGPDIEKEPELSAVGGLASLRRRCWSWLLVVS